MERELERVIEWVGSSLDDLRAFPDEVRLEIGQALFEVQCGVTPSSAKPLTGLPQFKGTTVMEIVERHNTDTFRAVYTAKIGDCVYVLHVFQKKSKRGIETPQHDISLILDRLQAAKAHAGRMKKEHANDGHSNHPRQR